MGSKTNAIPVSVLKRCKFVLSDFDDTLTLRGALRSKTLHAMERIRLTGRKIVVVTGRPAGWCDMIARMFPVDAVVGENGAFAFQYDPNKKLMRRVFAQTPAVRERNFAHLSAIFHELKKRHRTLTLSVDQSYRICDIAIDVCEDRVPLDRSIVDDIMRAYAAAGAQCKLSSIHINAWLGDHSKPWMSIKILEEWFGVTAARMTEHAIFVGDSPNDEEMFRTFPRSVGVSNIADFLDRMTHRPAYVTSAPGGRGFEQFARQLLQS